jgi:hypothetical protein
MEEVRDGMKVVRLEVAEECARQIRASEGELARIGVRLSEAVPMSAVSPTRASASPADLAGGVFWLPRQTTSQLHASVDQMSSQPQSPISRPLLPFQVAAEVYDVTMNRNPPSETRVSSNHGQPGCSSSVALSLQKQVQEEQNQVNRQAQEEEARIDEEERDLEEQETILAAKARSRGARVRRELDDRSFEVAAARSESLARIEDERVNDMGFAHGLDADSIDSWIDGTHRDGGPEGDIMTPLVINPDTSRSVSGPDAPDPGVPLTCFKSPITKFW